MPGGSRDTHKSLAECRYVEFTLVDERVASLRLRVIGGKTLTGLCLCIESQFRVFSLLGDPEWSPV